MAEAATEPISDGQARPASAAGAADLGLRFLLEVAALTALASWGFHAGTSSAGDLGLGLGTPLAAATIWGVWAAPKSGRRLTGWRRCNSPSSERERSRSSPRGSPSSEPCSARSSWSTP